MKYRIIFTVQIILLVKCLFAQTSEPVVKAAFLYYFGQYITWQNQNEFTDFSIALMTNDAEFVRTLEKIASTYTIKNKHIRIIKATRINQLQNVQMVYVEKEYLRNITEIANLIKGANTLLVTYLCPNFNLTMIDITHDLKQNVLAFELNLQNLNREKLVCTDELIRNGKTYLEIEHLSDKTKQELSDKILQIYDLQTDFDKKAKELDKLNQEKKTDEDRIKRLNDSIINLDRKFKDRESKLNALSLKINSKDTVLQDLEKRSTIQKLERKRLENDIEKQEQSIKEANQKLNNLVSSINEKQKKIDKQHSAITEIEERLSTQKIIAYFLISLVVTMCVVVWVAVRGYVERRERNAKLESEVSIRTQELEDSRLHLQLLWEESPVVIFKMNLSAVLQKIDELAIIDENQLVGLFVQHPAMIAEIIAKIQIIEVNREALVLFHAPSKQVLIDSLSFIFNYDTNKALVEAIKSLWARESRFEGATNMLDLNGELIHVILRWIVLPGHEHDYSTVIMTVADITKLKKYEIDLINHKDHLEELVEDRTQKIRQLNDELVTTNDVLVQQKENLEQTVQQLKEAQNRMIQAEKMASLGMLTSGMAHEINNPINFIKSGNEAIQLYIADMNEYLQIYKSITPENINTKLIEIKEKEKDISIEEINNVLEKLQNSINIGIKRTTEIISSLRTYSHGMESNFTKYNLSNIIRDVLVILHNKYKNRIEISEKYDDIPYLYCNPGKMTQVYLNLFSNAIDSIKDTGTIDITLKFDNTKNLIISTITDSGCGIPSEIMPKIFDPFFTTKEVGKGTGLGMYIIYNIITQHGGNITVDSEVNRGTKVSITLPAKV